MTRSRETLPPLLAGLVALVQPGQTDRADLARALSAARAILRSPETIASTLPIDRFIGDEAERGPWALLAEAIQMEAYPQDPTPHSPGDYFNVYSGPALLIGMALMYVFLTDDRQGKDGAR